jgi:hypothetical protein
MASERRGVCASWSLAIILLTIAILRAQESQPSLEQRIKNLGPGFTVRVVERSIGFLGTLVWAVSGTDAEAV